MKQVQFRSVCPHFRFQPGIHHGFSFASLEPSIQCSRPSIELAGFLQRKGDASFEVNPPPGLCLTWVQKNLQSYGPLFVRTLTDIPLELVPLSSHVINVERRVEGRMISVDLTTDEAIFKLDSTSQKKLQIFYAELTGKTANRELQKELDELRIRMKMADVVGIELLEFREVLGGIFGTGGPFSVNSSGADTMQVMDPTEKEEWVNFCNSLYGNPEDPVLTHQESDANQESPAGLALRDLQTKNPDFSPEDVSLSPHTFWGPVTPTSPDGHLKQRDHSSAASLGTPALQPMPSACADVYDNSLPAVRACTVTGHKKPKNYGRLGYWKPSRACRIPTTSSDLSVPVPLFADSSTSPGICSPQLSRFSTVHSHASDSMFNISPGTSGSSECSTSELLTPSHGFPSSVSMATSKYLHDFNDPPLAPAVRLSLPLDNFVYPQTTDTSPPLLQKLHHEPTSSTTPEAHNTILMPAQQSPKRRETDVPPRISEHQEMDFTFETPQMEGGGWEERHIGKLEKSMDLAEFVMQERMRTILESVGSSEATRDGVDNHPIAVRLRSLSGKYISEQQSCRLYTRGSTQGDRSEVMVRVDESYVPLENIFRELESLMGHESKSLEDNNPEPNVGLGAIAFGSESTACQDSGTATETWVPAEQCGIHKAEMAKNIAALQAPRNKINDESRRALGSLRKKMEQIHELEERIFEGETRELKILQSEAREMIELWEEEDESDRALAPEPAWAIAGNISGCSSLYAKEPDDPLIEYTVKSKGLGSNRVNSDISGASDIRVDTKKWPHNNREITTGFRARSTTDRMHRTRMNSPMSSFTVHRSGTEVWKANPSTSAPILESWNRSLSQIRNDVAVIYSEGDTGSMPYQSPGCIAPKETPKLYEYPVSGGSPEYAKSWRKTGVPIRDRQAAIRNDYFEKLTWYAGTIIRAKAANTEDPTQPEKGANHRAIDTSTGKENVGTWIEDHCDELAAETGKSHVRGFWKKVKAE